MSPPTEAAYFSEVLIEVNLALSLVQALHAAMMAREIPAAISPYSIAGRQIHLREIFELFSLGDGGPKVEDSLNRY